MTQGKPYYVIMCKISNIIMFGSAMANLHSTLLISIDRLCFIVYPLRYFCWISTESAGKVVMVMWVYCWIGTGICVGLGVHMMEDQICYLPVIMIPEVYTCLMMYLFTITVIVMICYASIGFVALKQRKAIHSLEQQIKPAPLAPTRSSDTYSNQDTTTTVNTNTPEMHSTGKKEQMATNICTRGKNQTNITKMMGIVLMVYLVCICPNVVISIALNLAADQGLLVLLYLDNLALVIWYCQGFLNFLIYAVWSKDYRKAFKTLLRIKNSDIHPAIP